MPKKDKIQKQYEQIKADIQKIADKEIKKITERVEEIEEKAEKIGEEIEGSLTEKRVKSRKSNTA